MRNQIIFILIVCICSSCTMKQFSDSFRAKEFKGLTPCERHFKKALAECPGLVDTTTHESDTSFKLAKDTAYINKLIRQTIATSDSVCELKMKAIVKLFEGDSTKDKDTAKHNQAVKIEHFTPKEKRDIEKSVQNRTKDKGDPGINLKKDTLSYHSKSATVLIWQEGDKLRVKVIDKDITFHNPCPDLPEQRPWWQWLILGFVGGILFAGLLIYLAKR